MTPVNARRHWALWAAAGTGVQVGAAIVATRFVAHEVPPLTLAMLRYLIGFACLAPFTWSYFRQFWQSGYEFVAIKSEAKKFRKDLLVMAALGTGQFAVLIALLNWGLRHIAAAQAALVFSLFPLLTLLLAVVLGREQLRWKLVTGVGLSIMGVALSLWPKIELTAVTASQGARWWASYAGELAVLAAAGVGALCSVLYRPYLQRYPTVPVSAFAMLASVVFLALLALSENWPAVVPALTVHAWAVIAFIGFSSGVGYFMWLYALKHESATRVTVFLALNPVTAAVLGLALLGESLTVWTLSAIVLIAAGLWFATRPAEVVQRADGV